MTKCEDHRSRAVWPYVIKSCIVCIHYVNAFSKTITSPPHTHFKLLYFSLSSVGDYLWKLIHALVFTTWMLLCHSPWGRETYRYAKKKKKAFVAKYSYLNQVAWIFTKITTWLYLGMKTDCHTLFFSQYPCFP